MPANVGTSATTATPLGSHEGSRQSRVPVVARGWPTAFEAPVYRGVLASAHLLHRQLRTTASYLPREERYSVKSITNDDRTTCCGMRLVPSRSWPYFGIRYSKLACLKSIRVTLRRDIVGIQPRCTILCFSFPPPPSVGKPG
ncbi:hypothetical protein DBV15_09916 [Temnothorax longispinosus]|uniref:Uncharacterized protein n=1 Tax=Temnothorax longispinosus TaxID=300112 RepID=A0A4S2KB32_9HYME|nr:hypothetical protein DBV15_09916 [Temnothorax longispinosus]